MKKTVFTGAATALVTPLTESGIDFENFGKLIDFQIEKGIDALVAVGTTGEGSTLDDAEHKAAIKYCVERVAGRVPVIAGTGSNDINYAIELTKYSCAVGADAMLLVTPYYNKATQAGMEQSFIKIADASSKPCILYNVPSRTGCNLLPATAARLALVGDKMDIYSGNDDQIVPIMSLGGKGVISVLSNILPAETSAICKKFLAGDVAGAREMQLHYIPLINALFSEVNPIPAKAACAAMGFGENYLRLPLTPMSADKAEVLYELMRAENLI